MIWTTVMISRTVAISGRSLYQTRVVLFMHAFLLDGHDIPGKELANG